MRRGGRGIVLRTSSAESEGGRVVVTHPNRLRPEDIQNPAADWETHPWGLDHGDQLKGICRMHGQGYSIFGGVVDGVEQFWGCCSQQVKASLSKHSVMVGVGAIAPSSSAVVVSDVDVCSNLITAWLCQLSHSIPQGPGAALLCPL